MIYDKIAKIQKKLRKDGHINNLQSYLDKEKVLMVQPYVMVGEHKPIIKTALIDLEAEEGTNDVFASQLAAPDYSEEYRKLSIISLFSLDYDKEN